ncbi:hypothetical protein AltI4_45180 (plasmid) [Alteromonas sp. I4]|nr:hypothetical protein AltI4_45180 [Alteromonas sp. I4]
MNVKGIIPSLIAALLAILSTIPTVQAKDISLHSDIVWSSPNGFDLTLDIRTPKLKTESAQPVLIIFHGGGWVVNRKEIMDDLAEFFTRQASLVTVNVNYRLLGDLNNTTTLNEIVEDAMGSVLWIKHNIGKYGGDPHKIVITGDSAGGHLAAMVMLHAKRLQSSSISTEKFGFTPTYLIPGQTSESAVASDSLSVQGVILSYPALDIETMAVAGTLETPKGIIWQMAGLPARGLFGTDVTYKRNAEIYQLHSPLQWVKNNVYHQLPPQLITVGELDPLTPPQTATEYVNTLRQSGNRIDYAVYKDRTHGYLDSGCNAYSNVCFSDIASPALNDMLNFINNLFD